MLHSLPLHFSKPLSLSASFLLQTPDLGPIQNSSFLWNVLYCRVLPRKEIHYLDWYHDQPPLDFQQHQQ